MQRRFRVALPSVRVALSTLVLALAGLPAAAQPARIARTVHVPREAAIASVTAHAGEALDLCGPGEELLRDARGWVCSSRSAQPAVLGVETYQTFEMGTARAGAATRFAAACLGPEDRVIGGTCVRRERSGYVYFAASPTTASGAEAIECALEAGAEASAVGIAICLDVPPLR